MSIDATISNVLDDPASKYMPRKLIFCGNASGDASGGVINFKFSGNLIKQDARNYHFWFNRAHFLSNNANTDISGLTINSNQWSSQPKSMGVPNNFFNIIAGRQMANQTYTGGATFYTNSYDTFTQSPFKPYHLGQPLSFDTSELLSGVITPNTNTKIYYLFLEFLIMPG